jgi:hypothetical protein
MVYVLPEPVLPNMKSRLLVPCSRLTVMGSAVHLYTLAVEEKGGSGGKHERRFAVAVLREAE